MGYNLSYYAMNVGCEGKIQSSICDTVISITLEVQTQSIIYLTRCSNQNESKEIREKVRKYDN